jgi:peptide/nickel transport system permease protein
LTTPATEPAADRRRLPLLPGGVGTVLKLIGWRLLLGLPLVFVVMTLTFVMLRLAPGDPVVTILGTHATTDQIDAMRHELGLDRPIMDQYADFVVDLAHGQVGKSLLSSRSATEVVISRLPVTLALAVGATVVSMVAGVVLGIFSALRAGAGGKTVRVVVILGQSIPDYWLGLIFIVLVAVHLGWFPPNGWVSLSKSPAGWAQHLFLPVVTLGIASMASVARMARAEMAGLLERDFVRTLRANGVSERSIVYRHALKNASIPIVTVVGIRFIGMLGSAVIIERIFALPGIGSLAVESATRSDYPVMQALVMYVSLAVVIVNLVVDVLYGWLNPRVRVS